MKTSGEWQIEYRDPSISGMDNFEGNSSDLKGSLLYRFYEDDWRSGRFTVINLTHPRIVEARFVPHHKDRSGG